MKIFKHEFFHLKNSNCELFQTTVLLCLPWYLRASVAFILSSATFILSSVTGILVSCSAASFIDLKSSPKGGSMGDTTTVGDPDANTGTSTKMTQQRIKHLYIEVS